MSGSGPADGTLRAAGDDGSARREGHIPARPDGAGGAVPPGDTVRTASPGSRRRRPTGILAALLAGAMLVAGLEAGQVYALRLAEAQVRRVAFPPLPIKYETLTFQRAALASTGVLPIYGSSELFCCGSPDIGSQFFAQAPTGFAPFSVGRAGTANLLFLETFGALGGALRGRRLVLSESPVWFFGHGGVTRGYDANFSPEIAEIFLFDAPLPLSLREAAARQMLPDPRGLGKQPLARLGAELLADPTPLHLLAYYALLPAGRLDAWAWQLKDAWQTLRFIWRGDRQASGAGRSRRGPGSSSAPRPPSAVRRPAAGASPSRRSVAGRTGSTAPSRRSVAGRTGLTAASRRSVAGRTGLTAASPRPAPALSSAAGRRRAQGPSRAGNRSTAATRPGRSRPARGRLLIRIPRPTPARRALIARATRAASGPAAAPIDWPRKLAAATRLQRLRAAGDPFGFALTPSTERSMLPALRLYCSGRTNRAGTALPFPAGWARAMTHSAEWTDFRLALRVLRRLGARPLVWSVALPGVYYDYTQLSAPAQRLYYRRFRQATAGSGFPALDFAGFGQSRWEMANQGSHFSPRGWVLADRALDLFWHGAARRIPADLAALARQVPVPGPPPPPAPGTCLAPAGT